MAVPAAPVFYGKNLNILKLSDLSGATIKMLLTTSTYVPDTTNTGNSVLADITNELASANGYTTGGVALASPTIAVSSTNGYKFSTGSGSWTASGGSIPAWRNAVVYVSGSLWGLTSPLLCVIVGDSTPADVGATASGNGFNVNCPAGGWFTDTRT